MTTLKQRLLDYYEKNEAKVDIAFFLGGFLFDVLTLSDVDDPLSIVQQIVYLGVIGLILFYDFLSTHGLTQINSRINKYWEYRNLAVHFLLGSLLSVYSLFFLKSSSIFSSIVFVGLMMGIMVANELKSVQKAAVDLKVGLYVICLFAFFSMTIPVLVGFVGITTFLASIALTGAVVYGAFRLLNKKVENKKILLRTLAMPGFSVLGLFVILYFIGWIPPVPLTVQNMGIYHGIEKSEGKYLLSHENPSWRFWKTGDQEFLAEPGDKIYFFAQIYSPARFDDSVIVHWYYKDPRQGWISTDKVPMRISGGRKEGFRGFSVKQNYTSGEGRISVETTDGREIGRIYFNVMKTDQTSPTRTFTTDVM
ncbi:DUF2914 domain-containing protein [Bdellovibrio sp. HCB290]|uniref:DUF2914 domain-containing protein n=1 Tax=Bdellovibrio sp. HCB290 TaxID=3394356 RepID=UPI0039B43FB2